MNIGINNENLDKLIKINNLNLESLEENLKKLKKSIIDLDNCYSGNSISFISKEAVRQISNLDKIFDVNKSYIEVLCDVKTFYNLKSQDVVNIMNTINSQK